jgi:hypothetical protein
MKISGCDLIPGEPIANRWTKMPTDRLPTGSRDKPQQNHKCDLGPLKTDGFAAPLGACPPRRFLLACSGAHRAG